MAAGPSLLREDVDLLRTVIPPERCWAVNCGIFFTPWAGTAFGSDRGWWKYYQPKMGWYRGRRFSSTFTAGKVVKVKPRGWPRTGGNSGHMALQCVIGEGAKHVALIGFDHQRTGGKAHFHGNHPSKGKFRMGNATAVKHWPKRMRQTAGDIAQRGVEVINLSRETAIDCFPRMTPEQFVKKHCSVNR